MADEAPRHSCSKIDFVNRQDLEQLYEGEWKFGQKTGLGFLYISNGSKCMGSMQNGVLNGYGTFAHSH